MIIAYLINDFPYIFNIKTDIDQLNYNSNVDAYIDFIIDLLVMD